MNGPSSKLWCWWCCHPIKGHILHLPKEYVTSTKLYVVHGNFCSFECMKTYNNNECGSYKQNQNTLISKMIRDSYGNHKEILPAPPRECLKVFGGSLDIIDFRAKTNMTQILFTPPLISHKNTSEIQSTSSYRWINPVETTDKDKYFTLKEFEDSQKTKVTNIPMKIKNPPSSSSSFKQNTLEKILGLTSKTDPKLL
jgi:hypothetical protein